METKYWPEGIFTKNWVVSQVLHRYVNGPVPPIGFSVILPLLNPLHVIYPIELKFDNGDGWVIVIVSVNAQPWKSVIVYGYTPAGIGILFGIETAVSYTHLTLPTKA